jgi:hypothetical protein
VNLWCPLTEPRHTLVGHIAPLAMLIVVGALAGGRWLGVARTLGLDSRSNAAE